MKKRILSLILTVAMMLSVMAILPISVSAEEVATFDGTTQLTIYNNADIAKLDEMVTAENDFAGKTITLGNDLTLLSTFDGIGEAGKRFAGTFDGQGHTVTCAGHTVQDDYGSFFVGINGATIKNVIFDGTVLMGESDYCGTIACGGIGDCMFQNVRVSTYMQSNGNIKIAGGFIACLSGSNAANITFDSCVFDGTMNFSNQATEAGGFIGRSNNMSPTVSFNSCVYAGTMSFNDKNVSTYNGCFVGWAQGTTNVVIEDCYSIGTMTFAAGTSTGTSNGGVLVGEKDGSNEPLTARNVYYVPFKAPTGNDMDIIQNGRDTSSTDHIKEQTNVQKMTLDQIAALTAENSDFSASATFSFKENTHWDTYYPCPTSMLVDNAEEGTVALVEEGEWVDSLMVSVDAQVLGAQIRITDPADAYSGIRFVAEFRETLTTGANTADANFGLILISKTAYENLADKTLAAIKEAGVEVPAVKATAEDGVVTVKAVVYNITAEHYEDEIVAVPYVGDALVGDALARSIYSVAKLCTEDPELEAGDAAYDFSKNIVDAVEAAQ